MFSCCLWPNETFYSKMLYKITKTHNKQHTVQECSLNLCFVFVLLESIFLINKTRSIRLVRFGQMKAFAPVSHGRHIRICRSTVRIKRFNYVQHLIAYSGQNNKFLCSICEINKIFKNYYNTYYSFFF